MSGSLREKLIAALGACPCCGASQREVNTPEDGIPDDCVFEAVFGCGAAAFVSNRDEYAIGRACPSALDNALENLQEEVECEVENEGEDDQP